MLLRLYHSLPPSLRSVAASMRGYYLRSCRYGEETDRFVEVALEREAWSAAEWAEWEEERLSFVLQRAATRVPYYRNYWAERRRNGDRRSWANLENWPLLDKEAVRRSPRSFLADDCNPRQMVADHTSGTTGTPLQLWVSKDTLRRWYALFEARCRRWYGVDRHTRWGMLGGQLVTPVSRRRPPFWVWNAGMKQLYLSAYHLSPDLIPYYLDAMQAYRVEYLLGYTSALHALAQAALHRGRDDIRLKVVIANAEPVFDYQRETIARAFGCAVRETYGMAEAVAAASECEAGRLHIWPEAGHLEILNGNEPSLPGETGELICTGLMNTDMPLIRYRVGDRAAGLAQKSRCPCNRRLPVLAAIEGRLDDVLYTTDGHAVGRLDPVFKSDLPICGAQIVQKSLTEVVVRYVPADGFTGAHGKSICQRLQQRLGPVEVVLEPVSELPRSANGKFRAVISELPKEQKRPAQRPQGRTAVTQV